MSMINILNFRTKNRFRFYKFTQVLTFQFSSPTEKRALIMKKKNFLRRSASSDTLDSYVNAVRSAEEKSYFDDQFDMNIK